MTTRLHCHSFHSVKGGVGKSTLSTFAACALAHEHPDARVYLVDMDLTGTSLADVLPIEAPQWTGVGSDEPLDLLQRPDAFLSRNESRARIQQRGLVPMTSPDVVGAPFLNDYLLFSPKVWAEENDIRIDSISWRMVNGPENLRVFPSSALPRDLMRALPVIYDEEHAAFLEARLEHLVSAISMQHEEAYIVFDTPPTIPGLSHSILNMAFRLTPEEKISLAEDGFVPEPLSQSEVIWNVRIVATQDMQDIRAAARWLEWIADENRKLVRLVINRASLEREQREAHYRLALRAPQVVALGNEGDFAADEVPNPILDNPIWLEERRTLKEIFHEEKNPPWAKGFLDRLTGDNDSEIGLE